MLVLPQYYSIQANSQSCINSSRRLRCLNRKLWEQENPRQTKPDYINQQEMFDENRMVNDRLNRLSKTGKRKLNLCFQRFLRQSMVRKHTQACRTPPTTNEWLNKRVHRIVNQTDPITSYLNQGQT